MRKKATNEDVKQAIKKMALELRNEIIFDLNGAKFDMQEAEKKLAKTFTEEKLKIYNIFYSIAPKSSKHAKKESKTAQSCLALL